MPDVDVGQVVFIMDPKGRTLVPGCIYEKVVSKTLTGENVHHVVKFSNDKSIILEKVKSPWFTNIDKAKGFLLDEAEEVINRVADHACELAAEAFPDQFDSGSRSSLVEAQPASVALEDFSSSLKVDLGDGTTANVHLPKEFLDENSSS